MNKILFPRYKVQFIFGRYRKNYIFREKRRHRKCSFLQNFLKLFERVENFVKCLMTKKSIVSGSRQTLFLILSDDC